MKRIIKAALFIITCTSVGLTLNSCNDALDIDQPGQLDETRLFTSVSNMNDFLLGSVYSNLDTNNEIYLTAVLTDEVKPGSGSGGQEFQLHRYFIDPSEGLTTGIWGNYYLVINRVNRLLSGASKITPTSTAEQTQYNNIIAQARAIRAFCYVQLEALFSTDMKNPSALGVILLQDIPLTDAKLPRSSNQEVFDFINSDLDFARNTLSYNSSASARYYVDRGFVNAVSARFNLYRGNTTLAKQYAQNVVTNSGLSLTVANPIVTTSAPVIGTAAWNSAFYNVASSFNPYRNLWNDSDRGEIIFALNRLPTGVGSSIGTRWNTNQSTVTGVPMWFLGRNLFNIINNTSGDVRRYAYIDPTSIIDPNYATSTSPINTDKLVIDKYPGKTSTPVRNDLKLFRLSEMYFILAECEVANNNLTGAQALIQQVRVARNYNGTAVTPVYASAQSAYADILKERRVELALEGHRYIDLKRLAVQAGVSMDRNPTDDIVNVTNLPNGSYKYTLPIPLSETSANPNAQQNPGY
ncbi:RagB/SusD family nutrient uptake outer membrane protein [uncultured Chryseobacterium sp.]|uniref:RagB/SusD family nutrient uptake outer membrane protein n=1 Tax=uncultured Chryseobacterium sp. TaxID=259322 RepID=UPI0025CD4DEF|nr:RagB/SusD family nutrient uptake outer membrane protein [uncultured Chryseobacterium sp.]